MLKKTVVLAMVVLFASVSFAVTEGSSGRTMPSIDIGGLGGAAHWLSFEAEDVGFYSWMGGSNPMLTSKNAGGVSVNSGGWDSYDDANPAHAAVDNVLRYDTWQHGYAEYNLHIPAAMDSPTLLTNYISEWATRPWSVHLDDMDTSQTPDPDPDPSVGNVGSFTLEINVSGLPNGSDNPNRWAATDALTGNWTAGDHYFGIHNQEGNQGGAFDNFLLYDGVIDASGAGTSAMVGDQLWQQDDFAGDYSNLLPVGVTPFITVADADNIEYLLDGLAYTLGTPIVDLGAHRLTVIASVDDLALGIVNSRVMAGADFTVVPEPATMMLLGLGGVLIRRKK